MEKVIFGMVDIYKYIYITVSKISENDQIVECVDDRMVRYRVKCAGFGDFIAM